MVKYALLARVEAKEGKEAAVEEFLKVVFLNLNLKQEIEIPFAFQDCVSLNRHL